MGCGWPHNRPIGQPAGQELRLTPILPPPQVSSPYDKNWRKNRKILPPPKWAHFEGGQNFTVTISPPMFQHVKKKEENNYFYRLCHKVTEFRKGPPVLLNTSFNVAGQPIVETPEEAIETFLKTDIDYLYFRDYGILISKKTTKL